jgi:hypothetical protein
MSDPGCSLVENLSSIDLLPVLAVVGGLVIAAISIIGGIVRSVAVARAHEKTKRELAAYVAEGSIDPDKAIALLNAGKSGKRDDFIAS